MKSRVLNFMYIWKWLFVRSWFVQIKYHKSSKEMFKWSKLSLGQTEGMLDIIGLFRKYKLYRISDRLRDKLVEVGYFWYMPRETNLGNLSGVTQPRLRFIVSEDHISIEGYIHESRKKPGEMSYFSYTSLVK